MVGRRGGARARVKVSRLLALLLVPAALSARDLEAPGLAAKWATSDPPINLAHFDEINRHAEAVLAAFQGGHRRGDSQFIGASGRGFAIVGWYQSGRMNAAYPLRGS